jgi:hypothetical protein
MSEAMNEPRVIYATVRDAEDADGIEELHIECRFDDGQKFAAVVVDGDFPQLAHALCNFLNEVAGK